MSDTEDEDFKKAIALSLQQVPIAQVIDLTNEDEENEDEDEDDDLDAPVTARKNPAKGIELSSSSSSSSQLDIPTASSAKSNVAIIHDEPTSIVNAAGGLDTKKIGPVPSTSGFFGLDRKKMEAERLARAMQFRKREREATNETNEPRKRKVRNSPTPVSETDSMQSKRSYSEMSRHDMKVTAPDTGERQIHTLSETTMKELGNRTVLSYNAQRQLSSSGIQFPNGVVKKTWAYGCSREGDDIKIEEVLQKDDLIMAVLSAFQLDFDWIMDKLSPKTKVTWVLQAKTEDQKANFRSNAPPNYRFCFPSMEGQISCMHSKLQLLAHPTHLRIVVPSANLTSYDWGETGVMENMCFLIDLPRLPKGTVTDTSQLTDFGKELLYFLRAMGMDPGMVDSMNQFDFSRTGDLAFVHTIGGSHTGSAWKRTGYCGLGASVRKLALHTDDTPSVDFLASSIGNLHFNVIKAMFLAVQGDDGLTEYGWRTDKPARGKDSKETETERKLSEALTTRCRIYYPTEKTIRQSRGGLGAAGTICFQPKWYDSEDFPRSLMRDCKSKRRGMLMHSKMILARPPSMVSNNHVAWAYVGSANLSESAWGRLVKDKSTKQPKLNCRNWECGVIVQIPPAAADAGTTAIKYAEGVGASSPGIDVFEGRVPVPMIVPGEEYGELRPWFNGPY